MNLRGMTQWCGARLRAGSALLLAGSMTASSAAAIDWPDANVSDWNKEQKLIAANAAGSLFILGWGIVNWDYFQSRPHSKNEGWFGEDTDEGGADKLGHFYACYLLSHGLAYRYERWGYRHDRAAVYGALSGFGLTGLMELGDSFSAYGFSYEDMAMNTLGSLAGYLLWTHPELMRKIDIRVELMPRFDQADVFTDYQHQKYLVALKLDGFDGLRDSPLRYLDLQLGYYARNYPQSSSGTSERNVYIGLGVNLSRVFADLSWRKTARVFNYLQVPGTHIDLRRDFND
jgi:uncharacterized protein YfiM (DUF2279 family)